MTIALFLLACQAGSVHLDSGAGGSDGGTTEQADGGSSDGGSSDGGSSDGGSGDGGSSDAGSGDGGSSDGGSSDGGSGDGGSGDGGSEVEVAPDYRDSGGEAVLQESGSTDLGDCDMAWTRYEPASGGAGTVILAHGFLRSKEVHADLASHLASWGLEVLAVDLCHSSILDTDHVQNGADMVALASAMGLAAPIYAGHSAGGLAAVVAGSRDPSAAGVIGLDPVDADDAGSSAASSISAPVRGLLGEPSSCNASSNGLAMMTATADSRALVLTDADHCDFEGPSDWVCTAFCSGGNDSFSDEEIVAAVQGFATAAALDLAGVDDAAMQWWTPGQDWYDGWLDSGAVREP